MTRSSKPRLGSLERWTGKVGKVTALLVAITTLGATTAGITVAWAPVVRAIRQLSSPPPPPPVASPTKSCFQAQLSCPETVSVSGWPAMRLRLDVENSCEDELFAYVIFKVAGGGRIRIEPPFYDNASCGADKDKPGCWEERELKKGTYQLDLLPPHLTRLQDRLGGRLQVGINWVVYSRRDTRLLDTDKTELWLEDDPLVAELSPGTRQGG